jgi:hypothetical protein
LSGGGDQGGFGEKPTHPKPPKELIQLGFLGRIRRVEQSPKSATMVVDKESSDRGKRHHDSSSVGHIQDKGLQEDQGAWTLEVFQEWKEEDLLREAEENISELDLDRKEEAMSRKHLAKTIYYSRKRFNPKFMFADMLNARGIPSLALVEKVGDYILSLNSTSQRRRIEFLREECGGIKVMP